MGETLADNLKVPFNFIANTTAFTQRNLKPDNKSKSTISEEYELRNGNKAKKTNNDIKKDPLKYERIYSNTYKKYNISMISRRLKLLLIITFFLLSCSGIIFIYYNNILRYREFYGNWEIKATQEGLDGYLIENISIYQSKNLALVYVSGNIGNKIWGPLLFIADKKHGMLEVRPSKFYGFVNSQDLSILLTQPFRIYYSTEYDRIIAGNAFFVRSKKVVWNN